MSTRALYTASGRDERTKRPDQIDGHPKEPS
jgi:hypothetical protein